MKKRLFILFIFPFLILSCNQKKIAEYQEKIAEQERIIDDAFSKILRLERENTELKNEIANLKETDQFYYQSGADEFSKGNFEKTKDWMNRLKIKFPASSLLASADRLIRDANAQITAIYERERTNLNQLLREARSLDIEVAISRLDAYVRENHPDDLKQTARQSLATYREQFERERTVRNLERQFGIRLVNYVTGWGNMNDYGSTLFVPQMMLQFRNISERPLYAKFLSNDPLSQTIKIKVDFINIQNNEVFGDDTAYLVAFDDTPFQPNFNKTIFIDCGRGYRNGNLNQNLPSLEAHIYINDSFYKKYTIQKQYRGNL